MTTIGLNRLLGEAVISDQFRSGLLNGKRAELLRDSRFDLEPEEAAVLLSIQAESLQDFAAALEGFIDQRKEAGGPVSERTLAGPLRWPSLATGAFVRPS